VGWWSRPDRYVCADCLDDDVLKAVIAEHAEADECDYCESSSSDGEPIAAPFDVVMEVIAAGIYKEWNAADNEGSPMKQERAAINFRPSTPMIYDPDLGASERLLIH
jgi:hypothetical protein